MPIILVFGSLFTPPKQEVLLFTSFVRISRIHYPPLLFPSSFYSYFFYLSLVLFHFPLHSYTFHQYFATFCSNLVSGDIRRISFTSPYHFYLSHLVLSSCLAATTTPLARLTDHLHSHTTSLFQRHHQPQLQFPSMSSNG